MEYDGKLNCCQTTKIVQTNTRATSHVTKSNTPTSKCVKLPPNLNNPKLPPNQTPSYKTWATTHIRIIVFIVILNHKCKTGLLLRWWWWWWCSGSEDPIFDGLWHVIHALSGNMTGTTTAMTNSIVIRIAPTWTSIINLADLFWVINMGGSENLFNRFIFDDDVVRCWRGCKNSLNIFELWLRLLGEDGDVNRMIGGIKPHEKDIHDFCVGDGTSKRNELAFHSQHGLDIGRLGSWVAS